MPDEATAAVIEGALGSPELTAAVVGALATKHAIADSTAHTSELWMLTIAPNRFMPRPFRCLPPARYAAHGRLSSVHRVIVGGPSPARG